MPNKFQFEKCRVEAFCVAFGEGANEAHVAVPTDIEVQALLVKSLVRTFANLSLEKGEDDWRDFELSENPKGTSALRADTNDEVFARLRSIFEARGTTVSVQRFKEALGEINYYYAIFRDENERRVVAFKQARRIRASVKAHYIVVGESLSVAKDKLFDLDPHFDFLVGRKDILALGANALEVIAEVETFLRDKYKARARALASSVPQVDWGVLSRYADDRSRAQRLLIALSRRGDIKNLSSKLLRTALDANRCEYTYINNRFAPKRTFELAFLEVLEGRRWTHDLTGKGAILYRATNRSVVS